MRLRAGSLNYLTVSPALPNLSLAWRRLREDVDTRLYVTCLGCGFLSSPQSLRAPLAQIENEMQATEISLDSGLARPLNDGLDWESSVLSWDSAMNLCTTQRSLGSGRSANSHSLQGIHHKIRVFLCPGGVRDFDGIVTPTIHEWLLPR